MDSPTVFLIAADVILLLHVLYAAFVVGGLLTIFLGHIMSWSWVRNPWFRAIHLVAIGIVVLQSWGRVICPLTTIEMMLRARAGDAVYIGSFMGHWLETILYYRVPHGVFVVCYTVFGAAVLLSWFWVRPRLFRSDRSHTAQDG